MKFSKCRIVKNSNGLFEIEKKGLIFGWDTVKECGGCDPLGFCYPDFPVTFKSVEDAENYIKRHRSIDEIIVIKEIE